MRTVQSLAATRRASSSKRCELAAQATGSTVARPEGAAAADAACDSSLIRTPQTIVNGVQVQELCRARQAGKSVNAVTESGRIVPRAVNLPSLRSSYRA